MKHIITLLILGIVYISCSVQKPTTAQSSEQEMNRLSYFEPVSYIQYIAKGNQGLYSDSLSNLTMYKLDSILFHTKSALGLSDKILIEDEKIKNRINYEIAMSSQLMLRKKDKEKYTVPPTIDSILTANNQRYALATFATGFGRKKGNYGKEIAKGAAIGILTLGMFAPVPLKSSLNLHVYIFDSESNKLVSYKRSLPVEKDPTEAEVLKKQIFLLLTGYKKEKP